MNNIKLYKRKEAIQKMDFYSSNLDSHLFIHYARENVFCESYPKGPRVISIAIMNAKDEQIHNFSLLRTASKHSMQFFELTLEQQDAIELEMLSAFFDFAEQNGDKFWLHWNMKNDNYGFSAIEERFLQLGGSPYKIPDDHKINISLLFKEKYGPAFAQKTIKNGKTFGKLYDIISLNKEDDSSILDGEQEIKEYLLHSLIKIDQSVLAKAKVFKSIMEKACGGKLKTRSKLLKDIYGLNFVGIILYIRENAILTLLSSLAGGITCELVTKLLSNALGL